MTRTLVTVRKIAKLEPIEGKDRIELAHIGVVGGFRCVVEKGLRVGALVAYHEPDSFVPTAGPKARACYAFLDKDAKDCPAEIEPTLAADGTSTGAEEAAVEALTTPRRARIRTKRLGGIYSQGLAVPMAATGLDLTARNYREGDDITEELGVTHYEPTDPVAKEREPGLFPWPDAALAGVSRTDETRLQSKPALLEEMRGKAVAITYKIDGQSVTLARACDGTVIVCSRNLEHRTVDGKNTRLLEQVLSLGVLDKIPPGYCVQGELAGPGIQKNRAGFPTVRLLIFNVFRRYSDDAEFEELDFRSARGFCQDHRLTFVPTVLTGWRVPTKEEVAEAATAGAPQYGVDWFVAQANSVDYPNGHPGEGIVVRPMTPTASKVLNGARLSFKVIAPRYEALT